MGIEQASKESIAKGVGIIAANGVVAIPTETVYGLAASAFSVEGVAKIFEVKERPHFDPLIVHIANYDMLEVVAGKIPPKAMKLMGRFWPGPLTLVLPKSRYIPDLVTSGLDTVAIRMPDHQITREFIIESKRPLAAPSANPFGYLSPTTAQHVQDQLGDKIELIIDGGPCRVGVESTILRVEENRLTLLRPGGVSVEDIEAFAGPVDRTMKSGITEAPGMLPFHYAPSKKLILLSSRSAALEYSSHSKIGYLAFREAPDMVSPAHLEILSPSGSFSEAANRLFAALHRLDNSNVDIILAEPLNENGIGLAIMNRLRKAAAR